MCHWYKMCSLNESNWLLCFYRSSENKRSAKPKYNTDSRLSKSEFGKILSLAKKSKGGTIWFLLAFQSTGAWEQDVNFNLLELFQPMTAQLDNVNCSAVMLLVESYLEG